LTSLAVAPLYGVLFTRRRFLNRSLAATGTVSVAGGLWLGLSQHRAARWARRLFADARRSILPAPAKPAPNGWKDNAVSLAWVGHATVLINFYGIHILTDPALGDRIGVTLRLGTIGPKRFIAPALSLRELPPIDLVLLSHAHMDHMDLATLRALGSQVAIVSAGSTRDILDGAGLKDVSELRWNERTRFSNDVGDLDIEAVEVKHWGKRWPSEMARGYNGYILRREGKTLLFGGDTANTPLFRDLRSRGPFDIALMPIGAYQPWIWNHCNPEQAVELANAAGARYIVPIHHQTFQLSHEPMAEPIERFQAALQAEPERIALRKIGESFYL
jgi:L-ascorbate metabolism protein UlaG (beta-lactamase superfamily)